MMEQYTIHNILHILEEQTKDFVSPFMILYSDLNRNPFKILIVTMLTMRTRDLTVSKVVKPLFHLANTPYEFIKIPIKDIEKAIYSVNYYKTKALNIHAISQDLINIFNGQVPNTIEKLVKLQGIGRKTANLTLILGFNKPGICVDTHVHRFFNRIGFLDTKNPIQTEMILRKKININFWMLINKNIVKYGQNICKPISPTCSLCVIRHKCKYYINSIK